MWNNSPTTVFMCSVQFSSVTQSCPTLCNPMDCITAGLLSISNSRSLLKLMSIELVMPSNHLILCCPLLLPPSIFASIRVFSNESILRNRWPKYWSFSFNIRPSNEYSGLISFRMDSFDLLAVQGTLKSLLQHHRSINSSVLSFLYSPTLTSMRASLVAQTVKCLPTMWETWVQSLGQEDLLEKEMATTHSSILAWKIPWMEEPGRLQSMGCKESDTTETSLSFLSHIHT